MYLDDGGTGSYNGLIVSVEHGLSNRFSMLGNYTYAHCIGDPVTTELSGPIYTNPANRRMDRGNCGTGDVRQNFNLSAVIQSPHYSSRMVQWIAGDWQLAAIVGLHSGSFFTITSGVDSALNGIGGQRPNQVLADPYCANRSYACWLNERSFAPPPNGTFGNLGVSNLSGQNYFGMGLALSRRFPVKERQYFKIRGDASISKSGQLLESFKSGLGRQRFRVGAEQQQFGKILSDVGPRIMQFAVKYVF